MTMTIKTVAVAVVLTLIADEAVTQTASIATSKPGQVRETIGTAATVLETVHYQAELRLTCSGLSCDGSFPKPGAKRRLNITRMTCWMATSSGSTFNYGYIQLKKADNSHLLYQFLAGDHITAGNAHTINSAVDMQVGSAQYIYVWMLLAGGTAANGICTATGTRDTLQ